MRCLLSLSLYVLPDDRLRLRQVGTVDCIDMPTGPSQAPWVVYASPLGLSATAHRSRTPPGRRGRGDSESDFPKWATQNGPLRLAKASQLGRTAYRGRARSSLQIVPQPFLTVSDSDSDTGTASTLDCFWLCRVLTAERSQNHSLRRRGGARRAPAFASPGVRWLACPAAGLRSAHPSLAKDTGQMRCALRQYAVPTHVSVPARLCSGRTAAVGQGPVSPVCATGCQQALDE